MRVGPPGLVAATEAAQQLLGVADQLRREAAVPLGQLRGDRKPDAMGQPHDEWPSDELNIIARRLTSWLQSIST